MKDSTCRGFTLIELLVVIAIIAVLMGILMPGLRAARDHAKRVQCTSNCRSLTLAWMMYKDENDGYLVDSFVTEDSGWVWAAEAQASENFKTSAIENGALFPYMGKQFKAYRCPADFRLKHPTRPAYRSYSIANGAGGETRYKDTHKQIVAKKYVEIKRPSDKFIFVEDIDPRGDNLGSFMFFFNPRRFRDPLAMWHNVKSSFAYADGHAGLQTWRDSSFIDWCKDAMENENFDIAKFPAIKDNETTDIGWVEDHYPYKSLQQ